MAATLPSGTMLRLRSAIEPAIGLLKRNGRLARSHSRAALDDALHAVVCGAGHNIRVLIATLRLAGADSQIPLLGQSAPERQIVSDGLRTSAMHWPCAGTGLAHVRLINLLRVQHDQVPQVSLFVS